MTSSRLDTDPAFNEGPRQVEHLGRHWTIERARTPEDLIEAKALDDLAFEGHQGISMEELEDISRSGAVLLLRDMAGVLIGESQVITSPIKHLPYPLEAGEAYDYGTAIHPSFQRKGLGGLLYKAQEEIAVAAGKTHSILSVRPENISSLRARFKAGYHITKYIPTYYGSAEDDGARLIMARYYTEPMEIISVDNLKELAAVGAVIPVDAATVEQAMSQEVPLIGVSVTAGNEVDMEAHQVVEKIFSSGRYTGVGMLKPGEVSPTAERSLIILARHQFTE